MKACHVVLGVLLVSPTSVFAQLTSVKDCVPALAKDYYRYAEQNSLHEDFLRFIDAQSWEELKKSRDQGGGVNVFGIAELSYNDSYDEFSRKRQSYLERVRYKRTREQAIDVLSITTSARAYDAYEACLRTVASASVLRVWPARETMSEIELRVSYHNPPSKKGIRLAGTVAGGSVDGEESGRLWGAGRAKDWLPWAWNKPGYWGINQEKTVLIKRASGVSETSVTVTPEDGSPAVRLVFPRADAMLTLAYAGQNPIKRRDLTGAATPTPDNHENRGGCPNQVGRTNTGVCISRTPVSVTAAEGRILKGGKHHCAGDGCPWSREGPLQPSPDSRTISSYWDNWGRGISVRLSAEEYEVMSGSNCGSEDKVPVVRGRPVVFASSDECAVIAVIKWKDLLDGSEGAMKFSEEGDPSSKVRREGQPVNGGGTTLSSFKLVK